MGQVSLLQHPHSFSMGYCVAEQLTCPFLGEYIMISIIEILKVQAFQDQKPLFKKSLNQMLTKKINLQREKDKADKERKEQILGVQS